MCDENLKILSTRLYSAWIPDTKPTAELVQPGGVMKTSLLPLVQQPCAWGEREVLPTSSQKG